MKKTTIADLIISIILFLLVSFLLFSEYDSDIPLVIIGLPSLILAGHILMIILLKNKDNPKEDSFSITGIILGLVSTLPLVMAIIIKLFCSSDNFACGLIGGVVLIFGGVPIAIICLIGYLVLIFKQIRFSIRD